MDRAQFLAPRGPSEIYLLEQKITPVRMHTGVSRALAPAGSPPWVGKDHGPMSSFQEQESFGAQAVPRWFSEAVMTKWVRTEAWD